MKARNGIILTLIVAALLALAGCGGGAPTVSKEGGAAAPEFNSTLTLGEKDCSQEYKGDDGVLLLSFDCKLPQVTAGTSPEAMAKINAGLLEESEHDKAMIEDPVEGYLTMAKEDYAMINNGEAPDREWSNYVVECSHQVTANDSAVLSVKTNCYVNFNGAHPNMLYSGMTFDVASGDPVNLDNIYFEGNAALAQEIIQQIEADKERAAYLFEDYKQLIEAYDFNAGCWFVADDGLHIIFNTGDIAPYAAGEQEFVLFIAKG